MSKKIIEDEYLGNGVHAAFDGYYIVRDLREQDDTTKIALGPPTLDALNRYQKRVSDAIENRPTGANEDQTEKKK